MKKFSLQLVEKSLKFLISVLFVLTVLTPSKLALAEGEPPAAGGGAAPAATNMCEALNNQTDPMLKDKIAVITEEQLGTADNKFTYKCFRTTVCNFDAKQKTTCSTTYKQTCDQTPAPAQGSAPDAAAPAAAPEAAPAAAASTQTICEPVMVYVAGAGPELLYNYIGKIYGYMAGLGAVLAVLFIIVAGVLTASAGDNAEQVSKAKAMMNKTITGLILLFLSALILYTINPNFFVK